MLAGHRRQYLELPSHEQLCLAGLGFLVDGGTYTPAEIRETIAEVYEVPPV